MDVVAPGVSEAITLNEAKKIRALVSLSTKRLRHYPDTPTARELGYDVVVSRWMGVIIVILSAFFFIATFTTPDQEHKAL